ncbi:Bromodomain-domain-containing protein [Trametes coccinea BRFM310]|uniref:Bromodomain-domain-containing protein n=1 Tax=Trametes coccinea (strain BRFM310) TaxID=1353009 RepID=A0A1Y2IVL6_TRAC3|nr:Bromodomain-domain-containing protein [Trametes coccinea BRFM310]
MKGRKSTSTPELDLSSLNNVERLIFAQAVHEFGANSWPEVAKLLSNHPMITQPKGTFTPQSCPVLYRRLIEEAGLEWSESDIGPRSEKHLKLAQRYYFARVTELKELITAEEAKFKRLVTEIDEIRSGAWDDKIRASIGVDPTPDQTADGPSVQPEQEETEPAEVPEEETDAIPSLAEGTSRETAVPVPDEEEQEEVPGVNEPHRNDAEEKQEEGSDNEAVDELIGNFTSEKPPAEPEEDESPSVPDEGPQKEEEEEMEVDETAEQAEKEETPERAEGPEEDVLQVPESPEVPISATQDGASASRSEGKRKASDADSIMLDAQRERKRQRDDSELADEEDGAPKGRRKERAGGSEAPVVSKRFQNVIGMLHSQISQHRYGNIFHNPIKKSEAPDYHDIVKRPMDLKTIKSRVKDGLISNSLEFQRDIYLMFANAMMYNRPGSEIYNMAEEMMLFSEHEINAFRQTEGFHRM